MIVASDERERRLEPARDQLGDRLLEEERLAEVAAQHVAEPDDELRDDRLVEAEALADRGDLLGVGVVAGDDRRRDRPASGAASGRRAPRRPASTGMVASEAAQDVAEHQRPAACRRRLPVPALEARPGAGLQRQAEPFFSMFQNTGPARRRCPSTFLRTAAGWYHWPRCTCVGSRRRAPAPPRRSSSAWPVGLARELRRAASPSCSSHGQPNSALSQPALRKPAITGFRMSADDPRGQERVPAARVGRVLLGAAGDQRLPVHRLHVDLEAGLLQQRLRDRRELGQHLQVGRVHQHDRRAVVAGLLQQLLRLLDVRLEHALHAGFGRERRAADEHRLAGLVVARVADRPPSGSPPG